MKNFYYMYLPYTEISQQVADQLEKKVFRIVRLKRAESPKAPSPGRIV